jgi:Mycothiol maleylpyruvate isomerase N-terminal domain
MMLIKDRDELLKREEAAWAEFVAEVGRVPEHRRGDPGVVPGWSVNDLVFHNGRWAGVAAEKLGALGASGTTGEEEPDEVWEGKNELWAAESKSMLYQEAMARALEDRERARAALLALPEITDEAASWFTEETYDHYQEHTEEVSRFADGLEGPPQES